MDIEHDASERKTGRWRLRLSEFDFEALHQADVKHEAADALSLLPTTRMDESLLEDDVPVLTITKALS